MSNYLLQIHVLIEVRRCGSCLVLHIKHPSIPKPVWHKLTEPMYCPFSSTFRRCIFVRQVELAPGRFVLPSGHARTQPARAFPAQTVKTGWTLLSTGSIVVLVLQALIQRFLPGFFMNRAVRKAGQRLKRKEPAPARPLEEEYIKDFINSPQGEALSTPSFLVVSGSQGIGKSTMLNNLMCEHVKNGKRVLPLKMSSRPGEDLKLNEALPKDLQAVNLPRYYPEQVEYMLQKVNETCKRRTGSAVLVYLQLTTKSRGDKFSRDACDDIASTLGAFARNITYDNAACKFILEVSVSAVADIITERFDMSDLVVVRPLPFEDFTSVVKEVAKQGNDFWTLQQGSCRRWHGAGVEALLHPRGGQLARLGLDTAKRFQRRSERCGCGHQAGWAVVQGEGGTNWKEIGWPGSEGLSPPGGRGRTHGVSPRERRRHQNEVEASSWGASRLRPEENNQWNCGFEALAFRRQALSRGWAEVEGCRIHASFAGEKNCDAWDVLWVSHPRVIFTYCLHNRRYPTLVSMMPRYQYPSINDAQNRVSMIPQNWISMIPWYQYPSINDTQNRVSMMPRTEYQWYPKPSINDTQIPISKYQRYPEPSINDTLIPVSQVSTIPRTEYQWYRDTSIQVSTIPRTEYQSFTEQAATDKSFHPELF